MTTVPSFKPLVVYHQLKHPIDWSKEFGRPAPLEVEIGFGLGELLVKKAGACPERNFIGLEQHGERILKALRRITGQSLTNVRILKVEANVAFTRLFKPATIDQIYSLFPCPWLKKRHIKYRLFSNDFLQLINSRLVKNGRVHIVTDQEPYFRWILIEARQTGFQSQTKEIEPQFDTKFERKWRAQGQESFFEIFLTKKEHKKIGLKKDVRLKTYKIKQFVVNRFKFTDKRGKTTIIFKEMLSDLQQGRIMLRLVVAEKDLTQPIWISIRRHHEAWIIEPTEGQSFFPTPGVAQALEAVHAAALKTGNEL